MIEALQVRRREQTGKRRMRRLRSSGETPAVLYGHGQQNVNLTVSTEQLSTILRHGSKLVDLGGDLSESALIRAVHWDTYGIEVLHVDLARVDKSELVKVTVRVDLRGEAAGLKAGGIVHHFLHEVQIECPAVAIPDHLVVSVSSLELGKSIQARDIALPAGAKLLSSGDAVVASCTLPRTMEEALPVPAGEGAEPELIGRKPAEEEAAEEA